MIKLVGRLYFLPTTWPGREVRSLVWVAPGQIEEVIYKKILPFFYVRTH